MSTIKQGIKVCNTRGFCFGDYESKDKIKVDNFEYGGSVYKVRTHDKITRLEQNDKLLLETVPGATILSLNISEKIITFSAEGFDDTSITLELEPETEYTVYIDEVNSGKMKSNISGKITISVDLQSGTHTLKIEKA